MQGFDFELLRQEVFKRGYLFSAVFLIGLALLFVLFFRSKSVSQRINPNPVSNKTSGDTTQAVFAQTSELPQCIKLIATPVSGGARLNVTFIAEGSAVNGVVRQFEYTFGDGIVETKEGMELKGISESTLMHTYQKPGLYTATIRVQDIFGKWSNPTDLCKQTITVQGSVLGK